MHCSVALWLTPPAPVSPVKHEAADVLLGHVRQLLGEYVLKPSQVHEVLRRPIVQHVVEGDITLSFLPQQHLLTLSIGPTGEYKLWLAWRPCARLHEVAAIGDPRCGVWLLV